jgi:hypothetical protein
VSSPPPPPPTREFRRIMFVGETSSGKSTTARALLAPTGLPIKILNDRTTGPLPKLHQRVSWEEALAAKDSNLIVEDLISCKPAELAMLQELLNWNAHHLVLPNVVLITHSCQSNGIFPLLQAMTHLAFMSKRTSAKSLVSALGSYSISKEERQSMVEAFLADVGVIPHGYWVFDVGSKQFGRGPGTLAPLPPPPSQIAASPADLLAPYRKTAELYLNHFSGDSKKCLAIFDFLMVKVPLQSLNPVTLDFTLRNQRTGGVVGVSLLDYLCTVTTQTPPTRDVLDLHSYLARYSKLPRCFITNKHGKFS